MKKSFLIAMFFMFSANLVGYDYLAKRLTELVSPELKKEQPLKLRTYELEGFINNISQILLDIEALSQLDLIEQDQSILAVASEVLTEELQELLRDETATDHSGFKRALAAIKDNGIVRISSENMFDIIEGLNTVKTYAEDVKVGGRLANQLKEALTSDIQYAINNAFVLSGIRRYGGFYLLEKTANKIERAIRESKGYFRFGDGRLGRFADGYIARVAEEEAPDVELIQIDQEPRDILLHEYAIRELRASPI